MVRNYQLSSLFAEDDHRAFTADVLAGVVPAASRLHPYNAGDLLVPLALLGENVQSAANRIIKSHRRYTEQGLEKAGKEFIGEYYEGLEDKITHYQQPGAAKNDTDYDDKYVPTLTYQQSVFDEPDPFLYLMRQWPQAVLGKYIELTLARIFNGTIIDLHGTSPDIAIQTPDGIIYLESKSARFSNRGKYISPADNVTSVSRHGFFAKRNQIHSALREENNTPNITNYMALVDYDFIGGENETFNTFTKERPETFGKIQYEHDLKSLPERLREAVVIKSILIVPTWAAFMAWNVHIVRTRPIDKFQPGKIYQNESHPVAQYFMPGHIDLMRQYLTDKRVQRNTHTVAWLQDAPIEIETFGHTFLPFESTTL